LKSGQRKAVSKIETPANDRGRFLYLYFQCIEVDRVKWHISEECFCRGFKLKPAAVRAVMKFDADEKAAIARRGYSQEHWATKPASNPRDDRD
jgi:hypothetical protein